jgi:hypothetical protein
MLNQFGEQSDYGLQIKGILQHEVDGILKESNGFEEIVKNTINLWLWKSQDHLAELTEVLKDCSERRVTANPIGMNKTQTMGAGISVPHGLFIALEKVIPDLFGNKKKLNEFKRKFPQFKTY